MWNGLIKWGRGQWKIRRLKRAIWVFSHLKWHFVILIEKKRQAIWVKGEDVERISVGFLFLADISDPQVISAITR
jgi:hypothetical protein